MRSLAKSAQKLIFCAKCSVVYEKLYLSIGQGEIRHLFTLLDDETLQPLEFTRLEYKDLGPVETEKSKYIHTSLHFPLSGHFTVT